MSSPHTGAPMDQATLVDHQIDDVPRLIDQLRKDNIDVQAAFWYYRSEADQWYLYLVSDLVDQKGYIEAYKAVLKVMEQLPDLWTHWREVKLIGPDDPLEKAVIDFRSKQRSPLPARVRGTNLGKIYIEDAYIYQV
jgi:hypothetical protein